MRRWLIDWYKRFVTINQSIRRNWIDSCITCEARNAEHDDEQVDEPMNHWMQCNVHYWWWEESLDDEESMGDDVIRRSWYHVMMHQHQSIISEEDELEIWSELRFTLHSYEWTNNLLMCSMSKLCYVRSVITSSLHWSTCYIVVIKPEMNSFIWFTYNHQSVHQLNLSHQREKVDYIIQPITWSFSLLIKLIITINWNI